MVQDLGLYKQENSYNCGNKHVFGSKLHPVYAHAKLNTFRPSLTKRNVTFEFGSGQFEVYNDPKR